MPGYSILPLVRRVLIGASFLTQGIGKLLTYAATVSCVNKVSQDSITLSVFAVGHDISTGLA